MSDDTKKVDGARQDRMRDASKEPVRIKPKDTDFDKILERSRTAAQLTPSTQQQSKGLTEEAIREASRQDRRQGEDRKKDEDEKGQNSKQKDDRSDGRLTDQKVVAKGKLKQDSGSGGSGQQGYGTPGGKKELTRVLTKSATKSLPLDLQGQFAQKLNKAMKENAADRAVMSQQVINKIIQYVRIGINRKGEKEIQMDLHEKIFRGLKLRVTSHDGKVGVHFRTSDARGREVFEKNRDAIRDALEKKGIDVDEILVS